MGGGGVTIHHYLPAAITFVPELRLTHHLRLHEACSILFDSIPLGRSPLMVNVQVVLVPRIGLSRWCTWILNGAKNIACEH
ncbi:hypothetical protein PIB30_098090 [Stylosanthes scabra]|uniref:Uncharacterized protein n=1 Tax=Stylosanthes scabra TaxID=79078 RepID=A0ABU6QX89_9FABA|nr:hypothetical protein [Stylosanthes scabra]